MAEEVSLPIEPLISRKKRWPWLLALVIIAAFAAGTYLLGDGLFTEKKTTYQGVVPQEIATAIPFKVYYPNPAKLPAGYQLDKGSFQKPVKDGVAYVVRYQGKQLVFSVQTKPSDNELQSFIANYIPLKLDFQTSLGQGSIGAYQGETLASLPIINGPWIIVRGPGDANQDELKQILNSLKTD